MTRRMAYWLFPCAFLLLICMLLVSCGSDDNPQNSDGDSDDIDGDSDAVQSEPTLAEELGLTDYVGQITPIEHAREAEETTYRFDPEQGPICMRGAEYKVGVRDLGSDDLFIFLQGGGACWSAFCLAVTGAPDGVPRVDVLDPEMTTNPVADWNVVYLPYCDGSFFVGEAEHDDNINGLGKRIHKGLANLTAGLEVAKLRFPDPARILLAGSSGGAYGLLLAGPLVRHYYPDVELIMMADSGIGLARDGEPEYLNIALEEFNVQRLFPEDCDTCVADGHITGMLGYFLEHDSQVRVGMFSSWYDSVLATIFLQVPGEQFAKGLKEQTDRIHELYPDRFHRFIIDGKQHTALLGDPNGIIGSDLMAVELPEGGLQNLMDNVQIGGMDDTQIEGQSISDWLGGLIDNDSDVWKDQQEERGEFF